jgi:hypothetical protein
LSAAIVCAAALVPALSRAGMGFGDPEAPQVTLNAPAAARVGEAAAVSCVAIDPQGISQTVLRVIAPDASIVILATVSGASASAQWMPAVTGTHVVECLATDAYSGVGAALSSSAKRSVPVSAAPAQTPVVSSIDATPAALLAGSTSSIAVVATDPAGGSLSYAWSATGGTLTGAGGSATWTAPQREGVYTVTAAVTSSVSGQTTTGSVSVTVRLADYQSQMALPLSAPRRLAAGPGGDLYAIDAVQHGGGRVLLLTARGEARGAVALPEPALAAARGGADLWVTTTAGNVFRVDPATGKVAGKITLQGGRFLRPAGLAYDPARQTLWVADVEADAVRVIRTDGRTVAVLANAGTVPLRAPIDVAVDAARGQAWVLVEGARSSATGQPDAATRMVHRFSGDAVYQGSAIPVGAGSGTLTRGGGIAVGAGGKLYVADAYQGAIQVFDATGAFLGSIGTFGGGTGQLMNPSGLALMANGDLVVANTTDDRVDRFGTGAALPTCAGDADCDGLSDAWELDHGLDPGWAGDALLDPDSDGLSNAEELALGTDPKLADTDGDGFADGQELATGFDPLNPGDHQPVLVLSGPREMGPGVGRLSATIGSAGGCAVAWTQTGGPAAALRGADTATLEVVARAAGAYEFEAAAACGAATATGRIALTVTNATPRSDAGRILVVRAGATFALDADRSSDANGDALAFRWDQTLGAAVTGGEVGATLVTRAPRPGLYQFLLTGTDPAGAVGEAEVPVYVVLDDPPTAVASAAPAVAQAGEPVVLDATSSRAARGASFTWAQVAGPSVELDGSGPVVTFVPELAGRYAFDVSVVDLEVRSPPARVEVLVAPAGVPLPAARPVAPKIVAAGAPVTLDGAASDAGVFAWRQVTGPAAGLRDADAMVATAVPFEPGFYEFELRVASGGAESRPARVGFEARAGGAAIPVARIAPLGRAVTGHVIALDGRASPGAARWRWTQVGGPWVALDAATAPVAAFRPVAAGTYTFELEVDDGVTRSAPARVQVEVLFAQGVQ